MSGRPTLYELLGVLPNASRTDIKIGYLNEVDALDARRGALDPQVFEDRMQMLRVARDTLTETASRADYDAKRLAPGARAATHFGGRASTAAPVLAIAMSGDAHAPASSADVCTDVRANVLSMQADALAMRAEARLMLAGLEPDQLRRESLAEHVLDGLKRFYGVIGLLVMIGFASFGVTRCGHIGAAKQSTVVEANASEQVALQEYFQTHGVRPANMAELQLLNSERLRKEAEQRQAERAKRAQQQELSRFEEESRRIGDEVSRNLAQQDWQERQRIERQYELKAQAEQLKLEAELAQTDADRRRLELRRKQTLERINER